MKLLKNPGGRVSWEPDTIADEMVGKRPGFEVLYTVPDVGLDQNDANEDANLTPEQIAEIRAIASARGIDLAEHGITLGDEDEESPVYDTEDEGDAEAEGTPAAKATKPKKPKAPRR